MKLYSYWRSSAAYRVRIALQLKGLNYQTVAVHLLNNGGEQHHPDFRALNPQQLVPVLVLDSGEVLTQSLAIIEYLDEHYRGHDHCTLLPTTPLERARVRALALTVACDIHPLDNLRVLQYLSGTLGIGDAAKTDWYCHWLIQGLTALETLLADHPDTGAFCHGSKPGLADCCLVPQLYNARRFEVDLAPYPTLVGIDQRCRALPAFQRAAPEAQPDAC